MNILDRIGSWLEKDDSVRRVADDLQLTSELILLIRMMFADGEMKPEELQNFKRICRIAFDIPEDEIGKVIKYLQEYGYEISSDDAVKMFRDLDDDRKQALLLHLLSIAKSDNILHEREADMLRRTAEVLDLTAEDIAKFRDGSPAS
jgi:uncharacterized tellurite resistance protein B-like protein